MREIHAMEEKQKREKKLARREMSESERPVVVTEEEQRLEDFVDTLLIDPEETSASKLTPPKKKKTDEGPSRFPQVKPIRISKPPVPPQRIHPFQDLFDKLVKDIGAGPAKEICILKHQVNDTNILREKLKEQRKKNREMHAYVTEQTKYVRFQQHGIEKLYRMMKKIFFDFEAFKEEETKRKEKEAEAKKRRLESIEKVTEGDDSDEEEMDRDEMPSRFIEWWLEEEVMYEQEDGETFTPQHPEWFRREREKLPDFYQVVTVEKTEATDTIISWMYSNLKGMFVVKRRGGVIQYFRIGYDLFSLPRVSKTKKGPITGKRKVTWVINPAKVVTRIKLPDEVLVCLNNFKKWFYDSHTGEAVIRSNENEDIKILDPMDVFMFELSDLTVLNANRIHFGAGNANLEKAMLFQRAVERAWKRKREMLDIIYKIKKRKDADAKKKEERKKKKHEKKKEKSSSTTKESTPTPQATSQPSASSIYEAIMEDPPSTSEAVLTQETHATTTEVQATPQATVSSEVPLEPEKNATNNPEATTEE
ncbi:hypothetical protein Hanom_Chr00s000007g01615271 [Helianthus anomalus]